MNPSELSEAEQFRLILSFRTELLAAIIAAGVEGNSDIRAAIGISTAQKIIQSVENNHAA